MENQEYLKQKLEIYIHFLCFIDEENHIDQHFNEFIEIIQKQKYEENLDEFKTLLYLISEVSKNHHRSDSFMDKIERVISYYSDFLKQNFTKYELFNIFKKNPQILYFFFKTNMIIIDECIINLLLKERNQSFVIRKYEGEKKINYLSENRKHFLKTPIFQNYEYYFYMFFQSNLEEEDRSILEKGLLEINENIFDEFEKKCRKGENDSYISELIRKDDIKEFIIHINKINLPLNSEIIPSIFETNPFLVQEKSTLIEYAAFFGSIQIFNYLRMNKIELTPSLWLYAIHGNNPEIIHILEENHIEPLDKTYIECFKESIKCHHNEIARYIESNLLNEKIEINEKNFKNNSVLFGFHYYNYEFLQDIIDLKELKFPFFYACLYDHFPIVELLIQTKKVSINQTIIQKIFFYKTIFLISNNNYINDISKIIILNSISK